jgi:hypothetical protein
VSILEDSETCVSGTCGEAGDSTETKTSKKSSRKKFHWKFVFEIKVVIAK